VNGQVERSALRGCGGDLAEVDADRAPGPGRYEVQVIQAMATLQVNYDGGRGQQRPQHLKFAWGKRRPSPCLIQQVVIFAHVLLGGLFPDGPVPRHHWIHVDDYGPSTRHTANSASGRGMCRY
jgi:hypothetical protein